MFLILLNLMREREREIDVIKKQGEHVKFLLEKKGQF